MNLILWIQIQEEMQVGALVLQLAMVVQQEMVSLQNFKQILYSLWHFKEETQVEALQQTVAQEAQVYVNPTINSGQ